MYIPILVPYIVWTGFSDIHLQIEIILKFYLAESMAPGIQPSVISGGMFVPDISAF